MIRDRNLARVPAPPSAEAAAAPVADSGGKRVKLATVLDQTNDMKVKELDGKVVKEAFERFAAVTGSVIGREPAPNQELTRDQLSGFHALLQGSGPHHVDFSVWGPFGHRIAKRVKLTGMIFSAGETVESVVPRVAHRFDHAGRSQLGHAGRRSAATLDALHGKCVGSPVPGRCAGAAGTPGTFAARCCIAGCGCVHWSPTVRRQAPLGLGIAGCHRGPGVLCRRRCSARQWRHRKEYVWWRRSSNAFCSPEAVPRWS